MYAMVVGCMHKYGTVCMDVQVVCMHVEWCVHRKLK